MIWRKRRRKKKKIVLFSSNINNSNQIYLKKKTDEKALTNFISSILSRERCMCCAWCVDVHRAFYIPSHTENDYSVGATWSLGMLPEYYSHVNMKIY